MSFKRGNLVLERLTTEPWAITDAGLEQVLGIALRSHGLTPEAIAAHLGRPLEQTESVEIRNGVAVLPVRGPMFRYANLFSRISGATSYEVLARDFTQAVENFGVRAILLAINSPGGEVTGMGDLNALIRKARGKKPILAHVEGLGASAAYVLAAAADAIVASPMAILGSLGVKLAVVDTSELEAREGIKRFTIVSSQTPRKADDDPTTERGRAAIQKTLDDLAAAMLTAIADSRGRPVDKVLATYCLENVQVGAAAVAAGLADRLGTEEDVLDLLAQGKDAAGVMAELPTAQFNPSIGETDMPASAASTRMTPAAAPAAPAPTAETDQDKDERKKDEEPPAADAEDEEEEGDDEDEEKSTDKTAARLRAEGSTAERTRILAIVDKLGRTGDAKTVRACLEDPACSVEAAALKVVEAGRGQADQALAKLAGDEAKLTPPPVTPAPTTSTAESPQAIADRVLSTFRKIHPNRAPAQRT